MEIKTFKKIPHQKVAIVGVGAVGSAVAYGLINQEVCDEVVLINRNKRKAHGEAMDLQQSIEYTGRNARVYAGDYSDCSDAQIVAITLGTPPSANQTRLDVLDSACIMVKPIIEAIMASGFNGFLINVTNPVDIVSHFVHRISGLPRAQVIGTGTALDTARLKCFLGEAMDLDPHCVHAVSLGEHGDSQFIPWSIVNVGGKSMTNIIKDNPELFTPTFMADILDRTKRAGWEILDRKGTTSYGIATTTIAIIRAILYDQNRVMPVSTMLDGEFGAHDVFASVPCIINGDGVKDIVELHLTEEENASFTKSVEVLHSYIEQTRKFY